MLSMQVNPPLSDISKESNIFDPIQETLDQDIFNGETPKKRVMKFVTKTFFGVMKDYIPDPEQYFNLFFTGSLTTYQYSETSDMDISVWPNYYILQHILMVDTPVDVRKQLIKIVIDEIDGRFVPGTLHPIQNFVVPPDTYPQDMYKPGLRSAWDIKNEMWFVAPEKDRVHNVAVELPVLYQRAADMADKMKNMLDYDPVYAKELFKQIHKKRTLDQQRGLGDFSEGNIVYKYLLHEGLFDRLRNELGIYIARRISDGEEESSKEMEQSFSRSSSKDSLESTQKAQEHVAGNESEEYAWPSLDDLHDISVRAINESGQEHQGYRDTGLLEGAIGNTQMQQMYGAHEDIFDTAANLIAKIQRQQAIVEGNKRTATAVGLTFLHNNGYDTSALAEEPVWEEMVDIIYHISDAVEANEDKYIPMLAELFRKYCKPHKTAAIFIPPYPDDRTDGGPPVPLFDKLAQADEIIDMGWLVPGLKFHYYNENTEMYKGDGYAIDAKIKGHTVGFIRTSPTDPSNKAWYVENINVNKKYQRMGIATAMINILRDKGLNISHNWDDISDEGLGWATTVGKVAADNVAEANVKVIYDFEKDRIILGTPGQIIPTRSKIVGEYDGSNIHLYSTGNEFVNSNYLKRLWHASFPTRPLNNIYFDGQPLKIRS